MKNCLCVDIKKQGVCRTPLACFASITYTWTKWASGEGYILQTLKNAFIIIPTRFIPSGPKIPEIFACLLSRKKHRSTTKQYMVVNYGIMAAIGMSTMAKKELLHSRIINVITIRYCWFTQLFYTYLLPSSELTTSIHILAAKEWREHHHQIDLSQFDKDVCGRAKVRHNLYMYRVREHLL